MKPLPPQGGGLGASKARLKPTPPPPQASSLPNPPARTAPTIPPPPKPPGAPRKSNGMSLPAPTGKSASIAPPPGRLVNPSVQPPLAKTPPPPPALVEKRERGTQAMAPQAPAPRPVAPQEKHAQAAVPHVEVADLQVAVAKQATRGGPVRSEVNSTLVGMPVVSAAYCLASKAYSRVVADSRVVAPGLDDRKNAAQEMRALCEHALSETTEKSRKSRLLHEIARLEEVVFVDHTRALESFQKAHVLDPSFEPALEGLIRLRSALGQWEGTLSLLDEQVALTATAVDKAALLFSKATILEEHLNRLSDARMDYERALTLAPNDGAILQAVARCARRDQDWKSLDASLTIQAKETDDDVALGAVRWAERARIAEQFRKKSNEAAELYEKSFDVDPLASAAIYALERIFIIAKRPRDQVALLEKRAELVDEPAVRAAALAHAGAILANSLREPAEAAQFYERAWEAAPDNLSFLRELEELYRKLGLFDGVVQVLRRLEERGATPEERAALCVRIADVLSRRLGQKRDALVYWERARELTPTLTSCIQPLCAHYEASEAWTELLHVLVQEEGASQDAQRRAELHCRIARIHEKQLGSSDEAIEHYRKALGLVPLAEGAFRELSRLLEKARRYEEVVDLHFRGSETASDTAISLVHLFKVGQVLEGLLGQPERAIPVYRDILTRQPGHLGALFSLQRAAQDAADYAVLVDALLEEAGTYQKPTLKVPLLHRAAQVCLESLGQEKRALELLNNSLTIDQKYAPSLETLAALHNTAGRYPELLKVLNQQLLVLKEPVLVSQQLFRMGRLCEEHLAQDDKALTYFKKAFDADSQGEDLAQAIERCLERMNSFEELAEFLQEKLKSVEPGRVGADLAYRLGVLFELHLGKLQNALIYYERALEELPDHRQALDGKVRVLEIRSESRKTVAALGQRAERCTDPLVQMWARLRQAEILENTCKDLAVPISAYEELVKIYPSHPFALVALQRLHQSEGNADQLALVLQQQVAAFRSKDNQVSALRHLLALEEGNLSAKISKSDASAPATDEEGQPQAPVPAQDNTATLVGIAKMIFERVPHDRAALRSAELAALETNNGELLASVDVRFAQLSEQPELAAAHAARLGEFLEPRNPVQALAQHRPALKWDSENIAAARGIARISEVVDDPALLLEGAALEAAVVHNPEKSAKLYTRAAELLAQGGESEEAASCLKKALLVFPDSIVAAQTLHGLLSTRSEFDELSAVLSTAAQSCSSPEAMAEHWIAVAKIFADERDDLPAAIAALKRVEKSGIKNLPVALELSELYIRDRQWALAVEQLSKALILDPGNQVLLALRMRLAEIYHEHLDKLSDAARELRAVLRIDPEHIAALRRLLAIQMTMKSPGALETSQSLADVSQGRERAEALVASGKLLARAGKIGDAVHPFASAIALVGLEPDDASQGICAILDKQSGEAATWSGYATALSAFCSASTPGEHQARVYVEWGRVLGKKQNKTAEAIGALQAGLRKNRDAAQLRIDLITYLMKKSQYGEALPEISTLLETAPLRGDSWADLVTVYEKMGKNAESSIALGPLVHVGQASELQKSMWAGRAAQPALVSEGAFDAEALSQTLSPQASPEAIALLAHLAGPLSKVYPPQLKNLGASGRKKISAKGLHPCRPVLDRLCLSFSSPPIDLYPSETVEEIHVVMTDPVGLVIPSSLGDLSDVEQVCYLGRFVANIARGTHAVDALTEEQLRLAMAAALRMVDAPGDDSTIESADLTKITKKLIKAMPWLSKGRIEEAARHYGGAPLQDVGELREQLRASAFRAALILADDISPLFDLSKGGSRLVGEPDSRIESLQADLLPYWASVGAMSLRRQLGMI